MFFKRMPDHAPFIMRGLVSKVSSLTQTTYIEPRVLQQFQFVDDYLAKRHKEGKEWFVGDELTGADISMR